MSRYAVIDIGTNSLKLQVAERNAAGQWAVVLDENTITRLGEGLQATGNISPEALERNVNAVADMVRKARSYDVSDVAVVGTMGLRTAGNATEFVTRVQAACGVTVEILPGEEEARLAYMAVKSGVEIGPGRVLIFDTGGGSTEFIAGDAQGIERQFSLNVGSVRYTEHVLTSDPVTPAELEAAMQAVQQDLDEHLRFESGFEALIGIGGTLTNLSAVSRQLAQYDAEAIHGSTLTADETDRQIALYQSKTIVERRSIIGLEPKRADVILAGAIIVRVIMRQVGVNSLTVSGRGLRHAVMMDLLA